MNPNNYVVWAVRDGPYTLEDIPEEYHPPEPNFYAYLVVMVSPRDRPEDYFDYEIWFETLDYAYQYKEGVRRAMVPMAVDEVLA